MKIVEQPLDFFLECEDNGDREDHPGPDDPKDAALPDAFRKCTPNAPRCAPGSHLRGDPGEYRRGDLAAYRLERPQLPPGEGKHGDLGSNVSFGERL